MQERLQKYLYKKHPELFKNESKSMKETCMCWGCSCGDGWFFLLDNLCSAITRHIDHRNNLIEYYDENKLTRPDWANEKVEQVVFDQVKEKFGSLRIYYTGGDDKVQSMVDFAERLSQFICEDCGKFDYSIGRTTRGWIRSLCKECVDKDKEWEQIDTELETVFKMAMVDKNNNRGKEIELSLKKIGELNLREESNDKT